MMKRLMIAAVLLAACVGGAAAQDTGQVPARDLPQNGGAGVRSGNITSTGATVPNPGVSQSGGTTDLDRGVQRQDQKIESSICKGC